MKRCTLLTIALLLIAAEPWSTYRGNARRAGNTDGKPGPANPKVLWVHKGQDHFVAAPTPGADRLFVPGLGAFNVSTLYGFSLDPAAKTRAAWSKTTPFLKLPSVSSPALTDGKLVFGDGMHQTDGAILYCIRQDKGQPLWQLPVPGTLVHLEGSPTIDNGKVYVGGGAAGVLCVDLNRVTLDGKEMDVPAVQKILDMKWAMLVKQYEDDKKKDPDFAVPASEDQLPKPAPVKLWQAGKDKWHVDAPVAVVDDLCLVASAFLDKEQVGDRALHGLDAKTGSPRWRTALRLNPWGGPSVSGKTIVIGGSTIGFDTKALKGAKGEVVAFDMAGKEKWRKEIPGGVVSCVALTDDLVLAAATDGKLRAFDLASGDRRWDYNAGVPMFASPAVADNMVYVGDLKGVIHAVSLADGQLKWKLDLGADPATQSPGMIYGGPVVHGGRVYVATCNLEGPFARKATVVVCIGEK